jgi:hypothetical protein
MIASTSIGALKKESVVAMNVPIMAFGPQRSKERSSSVTTGVGMNPGPERWECINVVDGMGGLRKSTLNTSIYIQLGVL